MCKEATRNSASPGVGNSRDYSYPRPKGAENIRELEPDGTEGTWQEPAFLYHREVLGA